ncbi:unnamed protein product [Musa textilis]
MPLRHTKTKQKSAIVVPNNNNPTPDVSLTLNLTRTNASYLCPSLRLLRSSDDVPHFTSSVFPLSSLFLHGFDTIPLSPSPLHSFRPQTLELLRHIHRLVFCWSHLARQC